MLCAFLSFSINAQIKNGKIIYKITRVIDKEDAVEKMYLQMSKDYETISDEFEFILAFNEESAIFYKKDKLYSNKYAAEIIDTQIGYFGRVAQYKKHCVTEELEEEFGRFLVKRNYPKWKLLNETKKIDNLVCHKAVLNITTSYKDKTFNREIVAWYSPTIPVPYGVGEYGGLPGLILELQTRGTTYGVAKISLNQQKVKLPKLKKLKLISEKEFEEKAAKYEEKYYKE